MDKATGRLTVFFEDPFWVGVFERIQDGKLSAAKVTFGAEPRDYDVYDFVLKHYFELRFSPAVEASVKVTKKNPKRMQRDVKKHLQDVGIGTKSQQALKQQQEQCKSERKQRHRELKEEENQRKYELKQQKKKEKHRGR